MTFVITGEIVIPLVACHYLKFSLFLYWVGDAFIQDLGTICCVENLIHHWGQELSYNRGSHL